MKTAVIGAGVMGAGIAQVFAQAGHSVILYDVNPDSVHKALGLIEKNLNKGIELGKVSVVDKSACLSNISTTDSLISIQADLIIEAVV